MTFAVARQPAHGSTQRGARSAKRDATRNAHAKSRAPAASTVIPTPYIQRTPTCPCGGGCATCKAAPSLQTKLTISQPGDRYEREADRVADQVMRMAEPASAIAVAGGAPDARVQRCQDGELCGPCSRGECSHSGAEQPAALLQRQLEVPEEDDEAEELLQAKASPGQAPSVSPHLQSGVDAMRGGGQPLPPATRRFFEPRFGADFGTVRVHTGATAATSASDAHARAFTLNQDIVFAAGQYAPETSTGRRLLAHELTHVVQQGTKPSTGLTPTSGQLIQRALNCSIDHVIDECANAGATCQTVQNDYCKNTYPNASAIDTLHGNAVTGANGMRSNIPHAAENLLHFLGASGSEKVMPVDIFKNHTATKNQLMDVHREMFKLGAEKRLKDGRLAAGGSADMVWTDTANAFSFLSQDDLGLSVGGYTLCSKVTVSATARSGGDIEVSFDTWTVQAFDCYNWDPGKAIGGLFGGVSDNDLCCLENAGKGKHFRIRTDPWTNTHASANFTISANAPAPTPRRRPPPNSGDSR